MSWPCSCETALKPQHARRSGPTKKRSSRHLEKAIILSFSMETASRLRLLKQLRFLSCPSMKSLRRSRMTKEKEIDHWRIGGKPTGIISAGNPSRIDRLTNGFRSFANDSGSRIHVLSDLNSAVSTGELFPGVALSLLDTALAAFALSLRPPRPLRVAPTG